MDGKLVSELALDSGGVTEDANCVQEGNKRVSSRKRKPNSKYSEDDFVNYDVSKMKDFDGATEEASKIVEEMKTVSSRKRKPNSKHSKDDFVNYDVPKTKKDFDGSTEEASKIVEEMKTVSSRKRKRNSKYSEDDFVNYDVPKTKKDFDGSTEEAGKIVEEMKTVSSRKRKPNPKYSEDDFVNYDVLKTKKDFDGSNEEASKIVEEMKTVSSRKRMPNPKYSEDNFVNYDVSKTKKDSDVSTEEASNIAEDMKTVSSRKRKPNSKYSVDNFVSYDMSKTKKDFDGSTEEATKIVGEMKTVSSRKRNPNSKYREDDFVNYDASKTKKDFDGSTEEASNVAEEIKTVSSRKSNPKYSQDNFVNYDVSKTKKDFEVSTQETSNVAEEMKTVSSRKRKPNSKYSEDDFVNYDVLETKKDFDGSTEEASNVADEMKTVSSRKRKPNPKYNENNDKAHIEKLFHTHILDNSEGEKLISEFIPNKEKGNSSRKRNSNANHNENMDDNVSDYSSDTIGKIGIDENSPVVRANPRKVVGNIRTKKDPFKRNRAKALIRKRALEECPPPDGMLSQLYDGSDEASSSDEEMKIASFRKRMPKSKNKEDDKAPIEELLEESKGEKKVSSQTWRQNTCLSEDSEIIPNRKKGISLRKRNLNTNYNENEEDNVRDYSSDTMGKNDIHESTRVVKNYPRKVVGNIRTKKDPFKRICEKTQTRKLTQEEYPPPDDMLSKLHLAAKDPTKGYPLPSSLFSFFKNHRDSISQGPKRSFVPEISEVEGVKESRSKCESGIIVRETNGGNYNDEKAGEDYTPTAVILFFADEDSVPTKSDLHHMFDCYGPLNKVNTEVVKRLKRARVVFKRRADADMAFKSTGRFSIFGPSLVSYRLSYFY